MATFSYRQGDRFPRCVKISTHWNQWLGACDAGQVEFLTESPESYEQRIFRIENLDVLQALDLQPREGFRYSLSEVVGVAVVHYTRKSSGE